MTKTTTPNPYYPALERKLKENANFERLLWILLAAVLIVGALRFAATLYYGFAPMSGVVPLAFFALVGILLGLRLFKYAVNYIMASVYILGAEQITAFIKVTSEASQGRGPAANQNNVVGLFDGDHAS